MSASFSWRGRRVFVTGHTGFKGAWLCAWLRELGAEVTGYALAPTDSSNLYGVLKLHQTMESKLADILDLETLSRALNKAQPEIVFHLAAQALVRDGYQDPVRTFETNLTGTVNVLQAIRGVASVQAALIVTTDKCYEPTTGGRPFREDDRLGGHDPYSASKACAELAVAAFQASYFQTGPIISTARAGNVIGGGDWSRDRLVPDVVRATQERRPVVLRYPEAVRPWQHVFDPLYGYLLLAARALADDRSVTGAWNFGPPASEVITVREIVGRLQRHFPHSCGIETEEGTLYENPVLLLDASKARLGLQWSPRYDVNAAIEMTAAWYAAFLEGQPMLAYSLQQLESYARLG